MNHSILPFEDFLTYLQQQGFALGIDDFLQVQALLSRLPKDCPPEKLKRLLAPLLVSDEDEQAFFYRAFDRYFVDLATQNQMLQRSSPPIVTPLEDEKELAQYRKYGDELEYSWKGFFYNNFKKILATLFLLLFIGVGIAAYYNSFEENPSQEFVLEKVDSSSSYDKEVSPIDTMIETSNDSVGKPNTGRLAERKPLPESMKKDVEKDSKQKYLTNKEKTTKEKEALAFREFILFLVFTLIFVTWLWLLRRKEEKGFYLEVLEDIRPPKYWNIQVPKSELKLNRSKAFTNAATHLKTRERVPTSRINVSKTIAATIASAGFPAFEYLQRSTQPEYLLLIDQSSVKDQQAKWFEMWVEGLKKQEVILHRFFYRKNPEWCWDENQNAISLKEIQHRFGDSRLVVIALLSSSLKGRIDELFFDWKEKVWMATNVLSGSVVETLEEESGFTVLPARVANLNQVAEVFGGKKANLKRSYSPPMATKNDWEGLSFTEILRELKWSLNSVSFRWLCATAVYPEMNWDLTVFIGQTLFDERELIKEENVLPLVALPWFRKGFMPDELRRLLIQELSADDKRLAKEAILHLLQLHPLVGEEYSEEFYDCQLHIALEDVQLHSQDKLKLEALKHLTEQKEFQQSRYKQVVLRYLKYQKKGGFAVKEVADKRFKKVDSEAAVVRELEGKRRQKEAKKRREVGEKRREEGKKRLEEQKKLAEKKERIFYPKAEVNERLSSAMMKGVGFIFLCFNLSPILAGFDLGFTVRLILVIAIASFLGLFVLIESVINQGKQAVDVEAKGIVLLNLRTNQPAGFFKAFPRRLMDVLPFLALIVSWNTFAFWVVLILTIVVNFVLIENGYGLRLWDMLLGTQVVNRKDFAEGNFVKAESKLSRQNAQKEEKARKAKLIADGITYLYPKADIEHRLGALLIDGMILIGGYAGLWLFDLVAQMLVGAVWQFLFVFFGVAFSLNIDNANKGNGWGKHPFLKIVDRRTNELCSGMRKYCRRGVDTLILLAFYALSHWLGLQFILFLGFALLYFIFNLLWIIGGNGLRLVDYLLDTQVVNTSDFEQGNFEKVKSTQKR